MAVVRENDLEELRRVPLFVDLEPESLAVLTQGALLQRFPAGTRLFEMGAHPDFLHVLLEGSVQLSAEDGAKRNVVIEIVTPPDCFILAAALTDTPYLMHATVLEPARLLLLPAEALRAEIAARPQLGLTLLASLAGQFRRMVRQVKNLKLRTTVQRLGCYLLSLSGDAEPGGRTGATSVLLPYDKHLIASQLGMTRESLSRALAALREVGVRTRGDRVFLDDPAALAAYCRPDALIDGVEQELRVPRG